MALVRRRPAQEEKEITFPAEDFWYQVALELVSSDDEVQVFTRVLRKAKSKVAADCILLDWEAGWVTSSPSGGSGKIGAARLGLGCRHLNSRGFRPGWSRELEKPDKTRCQKPADMVKLRYPVKGELPEAVLCVGRHDSGPTGTGYFSVAETQVVRKLAELIGARIQAGRSSRERVHDAVLEERARLGREIHDGLAQTLGCLNIKLGVCRGLLGPGSPAKLRRELAETTELAQQAYSEVREELSGLKGSCWTDKPFLKALEDYLKDFACRTGIRVELKGKLPQGYRVSTEERIQLARIVQEALNNVRKHARATLVTVECTAGVKGFCLVVKDNGQGFELSSAAKPCSFGLDTMRERAGSIGGRLCIFSEPGRGTEVRVELPCQGRSGDV